MNNAIFYFFFSLSHQSTLLDNVVIFLAHYLPFLVVFAAFVYLVFYRKSLREFIVVFFSAGVAVLISKFILKILVHSARPPIALPGVQSLLTETSYAFPSDHATFFMALAVALFFVNKKVGWWFLFAALLIGFSRIAVGVHFPIDILGGFVLGAGISYLVAYFAKNV
ncbi:MAG: phosphatase PAP2 family protein [Candidatus Paceibacterota bacterium]|jgi:undecaprenyl-diphosphatase